MKQKDSFNYTRRSRWLFLSLLSLLLTLGGTTSAWADGKALPYEYGFEDYNLATDGWTKQNPSNKNNSKFLLNGTSKRTGSYGFQFNSYDTSGDNTQYLISPELNAPNGGNVSFYYKNSNSGKAELFKVGYSTGSTDISDFTWGDEISKSDAAWEQYEGSFPAGTKYVAVYYYSNYQYYLYVDDFSFTAAASGPALAVADGSTKLSSPHAYNFGLATAGTEKTFTLSNPGTESITLNISADNGFGVSPSNVTIAAKGEETLTVTMADATANGTVTITPEENVDAFTINVSGTVRDPNKVYLDFSDGKIPEGWTSEGYTSTGYYSTTYDWTPATGYIGYSYTSSEGAGKFVSPILDFANGENILFETEKYSSSTWYSPSVTVEYTTDATGATGWTAIGSAFTDDVYDSWTSRSVTIPVDGVKRIRFNGWYIKLRNIYGGQLPAGANFAIDKNNASFGAVAVGSVAVQKFIVTNSGNAAMPVTFTDATDFYVAKKIMFTKPADWSQVNLYVWDESNNPLNGAWPGAAMTYDYTNDYGQEVWSATLPKDAANIIFSNNSASQTADIPTTGFKQTIAYYLDGTTPTQWKNDDFSVPAKGETNGTADFYVRMDTKTAGAKSGNITLSYTAVNGTETVIPVSGVVMPDGTETANFDNNAEPDGWSKGSWNFTSGYAYCTSSTEMVTKKLDFTGHSFIALKVKAQDTGSGDWLKVYGSSDNGETYSQLKEVTYNNSDFGSSTDDWTTIVVGNIPSTVNKLKFQGYYVRIDEIAGLKYDANDPAMGVYTNTDWAEGHKVTTASVTENFGFATTEAPEAATYYIKNVGTGTMTLSKGADPAGLTVTLDKTSVAAGEYATLTVAMPIAENAGYHGGDVAVTAEGLGTFTVQAQGVVVDANKFDLDFASKDIPATWTKNSWSKKANGYAEVGYANSPVAMETTTLVASANENLVVVAKQTQTSNSYTFGVKYKDADDANAEWADLIPAANIGTSEVMLHGTIPAAGNYLLQFNGQYTQIYRIYGLSKPNAPEMVVYDGESVATATHNFGKVTDENDATWTLTVKNEGLATLTGLDAQLSAPNEGDNDDHYKVTITGTTGDNKDEIAAGASATITVTQLKNYLGAHSATLTISATGLESKEIALSGNTVDHTALNVDFDTSSAWPAEVLEHTGWSIYNYNNSGYVYNSTNTSASLILTPLTVANLTDKLTFQSKYYTSSRDLTVRYTTDGGVTWNEYVCSEEEPKTSFKNQITSSYKGFEVTNIPAGTVAFDFYGKSLYLDDFAGDMKVTSAPLVAFTTVSDNISGKDLQANATASYTLANNGNADYVGTVTLTNVTAAVAGEDVTYEGTTLTVPAGKTATITVTSDFTAPYGEKTGSMVITSESWVGDINVNYTATLVDPTDFVEDFSGNARPAGWYSENWTFTGGEASVNATKNSLITEKIKAQEGNNTLTFDALSTSEVEASRVLKVYTSADRKSWTQLGEDIALTDVSTTYNRTLTNGEQYIKFVGVTAKIDDIKGVKKVDLPAHDLYEVSTTMAATGIPGASYTATVVGVSLRADETVTAQLLMQKGSEDIIVVKELTDQEMVVNTNKTFTLTGNLPNAEGKYKMWAKVYNEDITLTTDKIDFTLEHTHTMAITTFPNAAAVQTDDNNQYTGTFFVTVQNTGSAAIAANDVSVSLIDNNNNENVFTSTWTAENSNVLYMNTKKDAIDIATDCTLKAWCWNTNEDGEWITFTNVNDGFWSLNLNGKTNFKIVRYNDAGTDPDPWKNVWNQSGDMSLAGNGNLVKFNGYSGDDLTFTNDNMGYLDPTMTTTLKITVSGTLTDGEDANLAFKAKENKSNSYYGGGLTSNLNVTAAPVIELNEAFGTIASTGNNRKVTLNRTIVNGWNTVCLPFAMTAEQITTMFGAEAKVYSFDGLNDANLNFNLTTEMAAGTPYLVHTTTSVLASNEISGVTVVNEVADTEYFKGTFTPMGAGDLNGKYGVSSENKIQQGNAKTTMKGFRAYFEGISASARIAIFDETTGITQIFGANEIFGKDDKVYDLNGRRVEHATQKGVYIMNGRKMVVK